MDTGQRARAQSFVELHRSGCFLLPNAWDAGSARVLEAAGFAAIATTSAGVAFSYGRPDHDFRAEAEEGRVDQATMMRRIGEITGAVGIPVSADLEEGFGPDVQAVATTIAEAIAVGAAGGNIEDFTGVRAAPLFDEVHAVDRVRAARAAVAASGAPFVLVGRTDALLVGAGLDEAIRRSNAYLAAGADCAFVPGAADADTIATLVRELDGPLNVVMGLTATLTMAELADLGVRRVTVGGSIARMLYRHLFDAARELADHGTFGYADDQLGQDTLNELFTRRNRPGAE
ncbi:isocitrate lyase/PEP mutase family protein [Nocardia caishijiensis]|uniref:isocitrate lyase/PEP mutase family protein n=1 Tax=Nocardia caishijiensis TaxID=184756 RepID=UPI00157DD7B8|nr:isocitrate lyase/phosphoenolpyruvate mutase family protein [Nocardia caishijiensis]